MKKKQFSIVVLTLFLLFTASITWAQTISSQKGLTTVVFNLKEGKMKILLPDYIRPGDHISGTILMEPSGKNKEARNKSLKELLKKNIRIGQTTGPFQNADSFQKTIQDTREFYHFNTTVHLPFAVSLFISDGKEMQQPINLKTTDLFPVQSGCSNPSHVLNNSALNINGPFDGNASNTKCTINNKPVEVIAESPRQSIIQMPDVQTGKQQISISENGKIICTSEINTVELLVTAGKTNLLRGERSFIQVTIKGLEQIKDTATLIINNKSTDVITLTPFQTQTIFLVPDSFMNRGTYNKQFEITGVSPGSFNVNVDLQLPDAMYDLKVMDNQFEQNPGSYGWRGGNPCETKGPITWRWHRTLPCAIELKVEEYGVTPESKEVIDFIIDQFKKLSKKGGNIGEKMAKCFSFKGKSFWIFARCYREWDDWDVTYECINGVWVQTGMVHVLSGRDDLSGWVKLMAAGGNYEWLPTDSYEWVIEGIAKSVFCCD
jgi:hypothetical protein